jgi:hypothetical protein
MSKQVHGTAYKYKQISTSSIQLRTTWWPLPSAVGFRTQRNCIEKFQEKKKKISAGRMLVRCVITAMLKADLADRSVQRTKQTHSTENDADLEHFQG